MRWFYALVTLFLVANLYYTYRGDIILNAIPIAFILLYTAFYHFDKLFLFVIFFTPLSINIEEFVSAQVGLFLPTEPLLFGMLLLIVFNQLMKNQFDSRFLKHPITLIFIAQLLWILLTSITSTHPEVSFKFLLTKLWFIIPIYFYGTLFFKN